MKKTNYVLAWELESTVTAAKSSIKLDYSWLDST